jgi:hypothetical protein
MGIGPLPQRFKLEVSINDKIETKYVSLGVFAFHAYIPSETFLLVQ